MEAGVAVASEGLCFLKKIVGFALSLAGGVGAVAGGLAKGLGAAGTITRMGTNVVESGIGGVREFIKDGQYTRELHRSELGGIAKDFGIKMRRSTPEEIRRTFNFGDVLIQDKGDGVTGIYDRYGILIGIRKKDGSYGGARFLSEEDRNKYGKFDFNQTYGVINTETGSFVQAKGFTPINTDNRIGKVENTNIIKNLNKTM
jgi:hypothetical protein